MRVGKVARPVAHSSDDCRRMGRRGGSSGNVALDWRGYCHRGAAPVEMVNGCMATAASSFNGTLPWVDDGQAEALCTAYGDGWSAWRGGRRRVFDMVLLYDEVDLLEARMHEVKRLQGFELATKCQPTQTLRVIRHTLYSLVWGSRADQAPHRVDSCGRCRRLLCHR